MQLDQGFRHAQALDQLGILTLQRVNPGIPGIGRFATAGLGFQPLCTVFAKLTAPSADLRGVQPLPPQPRAFLSVSQGFELGQQTLLLSSTELTPAALFQCRGCSHFHGRIHHDLQAKPP